MQAAAKSTRNKRAFIKRQIVDYIRRERLGPGAPLPSQNELARQLSVTPLTTHRAMGELASEGVIHRIRGKGSFVGSGPVLPQSRPVCLVLPGANLNKPSHNPTHWEYVQRLLSAFVDAVGEQRVFSTLTVPFGYDPEEQAERFTPESVVFFLANHREYGPLMSRLLQRPRGAVAALGGAVEGVECLSLGFDRGQGRKLGVAHLIEAGYRRIAYLSNDPEWEKSDYRGYCDGLGEAGLEADRHRIVSRQERVLPDLFVREVREIRAAGADAICVATDGLALQLIDYLRQEGVAVPDDVAVQGFEALPSATCHPPYLSSIEPPYADLIRAALEAFDAQPRAAWMGRHIQLPCRLAAGHTVGRGAAASPGAEATCAPGAAAPGRGSGEFGKGALPASDVG